MAYPCANCVYRCTHYCGIFCGRSRFWIFFISLLMMAVSSWADCLFRDDVTCAGSWTCYGSIPSGFPAGNCNVSRLSCGSNRPYGVITEAPYCSMWNVVSMRGYCCGTQSDADSVQCVNEGNTWVNGECRGPIDSTACDSYRQECESYGGKFTGNVVATDVSETGCLSFCDMCNSTSQNLYRRSRALLCCRQGKVPPENVTSCANNELSGSPDMSFSSFDCDNRGGFDCDCEDLTAENATTYNSICNDNEWPEEGGGGEGGESSSSGESPSDTSSGDWEYDYRDSLRRIIKYDSLNLENTSVIVSCLLQPQSCAGLEGDSIVVNVPSDSAILKDIRQNQETMIHLFDTSIHSVGNVIDTSFLNSSTRLGASIDYSLGRANDSLIDSIGKYVRSMSGRTADSLHGVAAAVRGLNGSISNMDSANRASMNQIISSLSGLGDSIGGLGGAFDTAMYGGNHGARSVDTSYGSYINTMSNRYANLARNASGGTWGDTATLETVFRTTYEDTVGNSPHGQDSISEAQYSYLADSAELMLARAKDSLMQDTSLLRSYYDTLKTEMQIWNWDSILIGPIRDAIPDNNICPEDCFKGQFALPGTGDIAYDFGLCRRWPILMDQDVFMFIRILLRLITAVSCIYIGMWTIAGRKD